MTLASLSYPPIPIWELGPISLSLHGLFAGIGLLAGATLMMRQVRRRGLDVDRAASVLTWAMVAGILGARLFTVPAHIGDPGYGWGSVVGIAGDFSILGGYAGGILGALLRLRMLNMKPHPYLDTAATGLAMGAVIGRIGDLAIVEHLGSPTSFFLGYLTKPGYDLSPQHDGLEALCLVNNFCGPYHHTALYDMLGAAILFGALYWATTHWTGRRHGQLFALWLLWYGLQRFLIDFTRLGAARDGIKLPDGTISSGSVIADGVIGPLTGSQWGGLLAGSLGIILIWVFKQRQSVVGQASDILLDEVPE